MKRPARLTLMDREKVSALVSRCTEQRERAEKAERLTVLLRTERDTAETRIETAEQIFRDILAMDEYEEVAMPKVEVMARNWLGLPCPHENTVVEIHGCRRLVEGEVDDDLHEVEVCTDCGADLPPKEKPPLYAGSPALRDWADMHGELHEETP